jgi:fumarate hydratase class I
MESVTEKKISEVSYNLLVRAATKYPKNFLSKMIQGLKQEDKQGPRSVITSVVENILAAAEGPASLCQDVGVPTFHLYLNPGVMLQGDIERGIREATIQATGEVPIRKNVVEPFTFQNPGDNAGWGAPFIYYHYSPQVGPLRIRAELKGFGGEIKSSSDWVFTSTPSMEDAVLAYVLNNVILSKGEGCVPGFLGVGVGGYVSEAMTNAKNAVFRELTSLSQEHSTQDTTKFKRLEDRIRRCVNALGLGPMGSGGKTTTLGVYLEKRGTHTAVAPVSVSQQCWASRGSEALVTPDRVTYLTPHVEAEDISAIRKTLSREMSTSKGEGRVYYLELPVEPETLLKLRTWDVVYLNGTICTSRDGAHRRMREKVEAERQEEIPVEILRNGAIYHCGPVIAKEGGRWRINSAGPTTSSRFTTDAAFLTERGIIKLVIGKGTMGESMRRALKGSGVYLKAVGGCAVAYQKMIRRVNVKWMDLGYPEAIWILDVHNFGPLVVGIDSTGNSVTGTVMDELYGNARQIYLEEHLDPTKRYIQYPQTFAGLSLEEVIEKAKST